MRQVGEEDVQLGDVVQVAAGSLDHRLEVLEHLDGLLLEAFHQFHGLRVQRDLPGHVDGIAGLDGLGVGADGGRGVVGVDNGLGHGNSLLKSSGRGGAG